MNTKILVLFVFVIYALQACNDDSLMSSALPIVEPAHQPDGRPAASVMQYNNTKGMMEDGKIIADFDCPDSKFFPPIDIKKWDKIQVVNGRFPTFQETMNGTAVAHYGEKVTAYIKPYSMMMPRLAYYENGPKKLVFDTLTLKETMKPEVVVVIQVTQTTTDTVVAFRYLNGGCGGGRFHKFHFLSDEEIRNVVGKPYESRALTKARRYIGAFSFIPRSFICNDFNTELIRSKEGC